MKIIQYIFLIVSFFNTIKPHGFAGSTPIKRDNTSWRIEQIYNNPQNERVWISSLDFSFHEIVRSFIASTGKSESNCYIRISFDDNKNNDILCTPSQEFYFSALKRYIPAYEFVPGDILLSAYHEQVAVASIELIKEPLTVYAVELKEHHNFFVGFYGILTHNMFFPMVMMGLGASFGTGAAIGSTAGGFFGPISFIGGIAVGGAIGIAIKMFSDYERSHYQLHFDVNVLDVHLKNNESDAQAPGKPTEKDGFIPKKNWDGQKVRHRRGFGWPDEKGSIWIPTGPRGHGCPHWDVQKPNGDYENIVPGGRRRGQK